MFWQCTMTKACCGTVGRNKLINEQLYFYQVLVHKNSGRGIIMDDCRVMQVSGLDSWLRVLADLEMNEEGNQIRKGKPSHTPLRSQSRWNRLSKQSMCEWKIQFADFTKSVFQEKTKSCILSGLESQRIWVFLMRELVTFSLPGHCACPAWF